MYLPQSCPVLLTFVVCLQSHSVVECPAQEEGSGARDRCAGAGEASQEGSARKVCQ